jgi:UDP-N-acetyl-2-amino-2-deoxyglucuronate dehydrogenase
MKRFALIGAGGYIAPRHMEAIKKTNNDLIAVLDKHDSVGIIDSYFPTAKFFSEFEIFDRYVNKLKYEDPIDYLSICSPNYLHDSHIRYGLRVGSNVICEKPVVIDPLDMDALQKIEDKSVGKINCILQLRLSEAFKKIKQKVDNAKDVLDIDITYITSRGSWYFYSWKGDDKKSGGLLYNIGVHLFDLMCCALGDPIENVVHLREDNRSAGFLRFNKARVKWFLSVRNSDVPEDIKDSRIYRSINIDGDVFDMSFGFKNLHTKSYENILSGNGFGISDVRSSIKLVHSIKEKEITGISGDHHPLLMDSNFR